MEISKKVLHVIGSMDPKSGGPCQGLRNIIPSMRLQGFGNEVITMDAPNIGVVSSDDFPLYQLGPAKNPWRYSPQLMPWLKSNLERFDIVIAQGLWLYPSYAAWRAVTRHRARLRQRSPAFLVMSHGMLDPWFQRDSSRRLKALRNWLYWKLVERNVVNGADGVLFTCKQELLLARESFRGYRPAREINVGYGVPEPPAYSNEMTDAFCKLRPQSKNNSYLLFISRIHPKKGVDLLLRAFARFTQAAERNGANIPDLIVAGPTDSAYSQSMISLAKTLNLTVQIGATRVDGSGPIVHFPGMLQGDAKWGAFYGCDAFVLPSHQENFGIAVAEALACSKPVLISNQVNIWREIQTMEAGIVANDTEEDTFEMLNHWSRLSEAERLAMRDQARNCYAQHFNIQACAEKMANQLSSVLLSRGVD